MTENEIIECLKENKKKGIGYRFLPEEVQKWIYENFYKKILVYFNYQGEWVSIDDTNLTKSCNYQNHIFSLSEDFELKKEVEGEWVEFEIEDSCFAYSHSVGTSHLFDWFDWVFFLKASKKQGWGFTAFGGWQYKNCKAWFIQPMLLQGDHHINCEFENETCKVEPDIPVKIRFWKISK